MSQEFYVDYEYGKLKEVIVGSPYAIHPEKEAPWVKESLKSSSEKEKKKIIEYSGKSTKEIIEKDNKSKYELLEEENKELIKVLNKFNVIVHRPKELTRDIIENEYGIEVVKSGFIQQYARDPFIIIGNTLIELSTSMPVRRPEILSYKEIFINRMNNPKNRWISMPEVPSLNIEKDKQPMLEGGDILVIGNNILVGISPGNGIRSNQLGYLWLKNYLKDKYNVLKVDTKEEVLHLDCVISVPRNGLVIVCKEGLNSEIPSIFKGWDIIEVSLKESEGLGINGMPIDSNNYILSYNDNYNNAKLKEELEKRGINVSMVYFQSHNEDGGSIRCSCNPLYRRVHIMNK